MSRSSNLSKLCVDANQLVVGSSPAAILELKFKGSEGKYLKECLDSIYVSLVPKFVDCFESDRVAISDSQNVFAVINGISAI
mgnify:CR=1 FL=1